jgi:preprotein translocase subunit SecY
MAKEEDGKKKLQQFTRYGTIILGLIQAVGMAFAIRTQGALRDPGWGSIATVAITLTAGTIFLMWVGELITDKGIGNGISLIIFAGIVSRIPAGTVQTVQYVMAGRINVFSVIALVVLGAGIIGLTIWITEGERRVPVQYAKRVVGRKMYGGQSTHIPLRINQAGVIPVIFASSVLTFPVTITGFINAPWARTLETWFDFRSVHYTVIYALLIIGFTYFYTAISFNVREVADNMKKYGGFIPGYRPGQPTSDYLDRVMSRITLVGAVFLAGIAVLPNFILRATNVPGASFSGTALLIVISVALETMKQIEAHLVMRNYRGFMR